VSFDYCRCCFYFGISHTERERKREREREREGFATVLFSVSVADFRVAVGFHHAVLLSLCV